MPFRILTVLVESDTCVRLLGECTKEFKNDYLGAVNGWCWQGGRFNGRPPHWVWGVKRGTSGGLSAAIDLIGQLLKTRRVDKVEFDCTLLNADEALVLAPAKRTHDVDPQTVYKKKRT